jgi:hypothetical protein
VHDTVVQLRNTLLSFLLIGMTSPAVALPLFESESPLEIEITGPLASLIASKEQRNEWPFRLKVDELDLDMKLKARGNSRMRICDFPPLRFNFDEAETAGTVLEGQSRLKLVSPCKKGSRSLGDVLEEYAVYRIFGLLSDISHRVRLVHITYNDTDGRLNDEYRISYGFLIEPLGHLASRVGGELSEIPAISLERIDHHQAALMYVFQYLIANTDWSLVKADGDDSCCHNVELLQIEAKYFPVPYDFDLSGLVNASYARPDRSLRIRNVRNRRYRGFCVQQEVLREAIDAITARKDEVLAVVTGLPVLTEKQKTKQVDYLEKFFSQARNEEKLMVSFEKSCHP